MFVKISFKNHKYLSEKSRWSSVDELKKWGYGGGALGNIFDVFRRKKNELSAQNSHQFANGSYGGSTSTAEILCCGRISKSVLISTPPCKGP